MKLLKTLHEWKRILRNLRKPSRAHHLRALVDKAEWRASDKTEQISSYWNLEATLAAIKAFPDAMFERHWTSGEGLLCGIRTVIQSLEKQSPGGDVSIPRQDRLRSAICAVQQELGIAARPLCLGRTSQLGILCQKTPYRRICRSEAS